MDADLAANLANWEDRAAAHAASPDYALDRFQEDPSYISEIVRFDLPRLGDVSGRRGVHLQCHIGTDTLSLARLGAEMTGLDFSAASLTEARRLASATGASIDFVEAEVYDAPAVLGRERFDFVFTGIGALCWLPRIAQWAEVVSALLLPGGFLFIREIHPMLWALDEERDELVVDYPYFETADALVFADTGTYVQTDQTFTHTVAHVWNHGLGEIVSALLDSGMEIQMLVEHDSVPYEALPGQMERVTGKEWRLAERPERLAHSYTLRAVKGAGALTASGAG